MDKSNNIILLKKLLTIGVISISSGIAVFFIVSLMPEGKFTMLYAALALLTALFTFSSLSVILLYKLYKRTIRSVIELNEINSMDKLTELYNRRYLEPYLENEIIAAKKENRNVSVIMVDVDHFKEINDTYGHVAGDHVLTIFSQVVLKCIRKTDIIARYGGDEFIVVLPNTDTATAKTIAERIREEVANTYIPPIDNINISSIHCSVGISTFPVHCDNKNSLIKTSDQALYMAKRSGRNCTKVYQEDCTPCF